MIILWVFIYASIIILAVGAILYKKAYKSNMNKALDGEARQGLLEPGQIIYILAVVVIIILSSISISKINSLQDSVYNLSDRINYLKWQNNNLTSKIYDIENGFSEYSNSLKLVQSHYYKLEDINDQDLLVYSLTFSLLEKENESTVSIVITDSDNVSILVPLVSSSLLYTTNIALERDQVYTIDVLIEGESTLQKNITTINVKNEMEQSVWFQIEPIEIEDNYESEIIGLTVINNERLLEQLKTSSVKFEVFIDGQLTKTYNLNEKTKTVNGYDIFQVEYEIEPGMWEDFLVTVTITDNMGNTRIITSGF